MAKIDSRTLFLTTSPRSPEKMVPELELLGRNFTGRPWNTETQTEFMARLRAENFFNGSGLNDPAFSARDRINRAPKSLGFVSLKPVIALTEAGEKLIQAPRKDEIFLRQLLKFQIPSPYHKPSERAARFRVKPYLEMLRLVRLMGSLRFDELQIFGMQLTDYRRFDEVVAKIERFRAAKALNKESYAKFKAQYLNRELEQIYNERIESGRTRTRESQDDTLEKFFRTQQHNLRDYADACFRYLRATGLVAVSHSGRSLSIVAERAEDVDFILNNVDPVPIEITDEAAYAAYLGNAASPKLLTDDRTLLTNKIEKEFPGTQTDDAMGIDELKDIYAAKLEQRKQTAIEQTVRNIKECSAYSDIQATYDRIERNELYDTPLMMEWNTWRAMTMIDGGNIRASFRFDDYGAPCSVAPGNTPDIVCDYGDFYLSVEVTMAAGQRQYETEGEPVTRHLGRMKTTLNKPCYCLFIAPTINEASIAYFYTLHKTRLSIYGGKSVIVPIPLALFRHMLDNSFKAAYTPEPAMIRAIFEASARAAETAQDEQGWYKAVTDQVLQWPKPID